MVNCVDTMEFIDSAYHVFNIESGESIVEICVGNRKDFVYTTPKGDWTHIKFTKEDRVKYADFLRTMVELNLDVARKIANAERDFMAGAQLYKARRGMNCLKIIDPSFESPTISLQSQWHNDVLWYINNIAARRAIDECDDINRLMRYANILRSLFY